MNPPNLSLVLVMICFWITYWLIQKFLLKPVGAVLAERRRRIEGAEAEWQTKHREYLDATARLESELEDAARAAAAVRNEQRQGALDRRQALLTTTREQADARLGVALEELETEAQGARAELEKRARELARLFASQLLGREVAQ
jgi:F-type H+-transporting ATPase subunit b